MPATPTLEKVVRANCLRGGAGAVHRLRLALVLFILWSATCGLPAFAASVPLLLDTDAKPVLLEPSLGVLLDQTGQLTADQIEQLPASRFARADHTKPVEIESGALWFRFDATVLNPNRNWRLTVPLPGVDDVRLHFRTASGQWLLQQAGDSLRMSVWPQPGRYPAFLLNREINQPTRYYVEIRHLRTPFSVLPQIVGDVQFITAQQREHLILGIYFGLAALVVVLALVNALAYRDAGFGSFALYMALFAGSQASFTGMSGAYLWPESPALNNLAGFLLPVAAAASAMWFVRTVATPRRFSRALDWMMLAMIGLLPLVGLLDVVSPTIESFAMINILIVAGMAVLLMVVGIALVEGNRHARWIAAGFLPVVLATLFLLLRNLGFMTSGFWTEYGRMIASAFGAPILFYGLLQRLSQQREPSARAIALRTTDPLTGLYATPVLVSKLRESLGTAGRYPQPFALLVINFTNQASMQAQHGREAGDKAMVMAAARIRAVARQVDTVARVGDSQFAMLMEGPVDEQAANNVATKILASGLRPSHELPDAEPIQFHIAVGHLGDPQGVAPGDAAACLLRMQQSANNLNDGSRKAIKLVKL